MSKLRRGEASVVDQRAERQTAIQEKSVQSALLEISILLKA